MAAALAVILFFGSLHPELWHDQARMNRRAILEYAQKNYPEAVIISENYPSAVFNPTNNPYDEICFELDGIRFIITAQYGSVNYNDDYYGFSLLRKEIRENYLDKYFLQNGIATDPDITFFDFDSNWPGKDAELSSFPGGIWLSFGQVCDEEWDDPRSDIEWFYDFFQYWKDACPTEPFILYFFYRNRTDELDTGFTAMKPLNSIVKMIFLIPLSLYDRIYFPLKQKIP